MPIDPSEITWDDGSDSSGITWDSEIERPKPTDAPIIISAIRAGGSAKAPLKSEEIDPSVIVAGFDGEITPDTHYHSGLTDDDKKEYSAFFSDPKKPPSAAVLRQWYHAKTGALLSNADKIVEAFRETGKFQTNEKIAIPKPKTSAADAYFDHTANAAVADYGPEVAAALATLGIGGDGPNIWNTDDQTLGNLWANNADLLHARLDAEQEQHPWASPLGELSGVALSIPLATPAFDAAGGLKLAAAAGQGTRASAQGAVEGAAFGSGAAGPGNRAEGAGVGAVTVPLVGAVARLPVTAAGAAKSVFQGSPGLARRIIAKAIKADENTPGSAGADMMAAHANDVPMMLADTGENTRGLLAAAGRSSGPARTIARDALEQRQAGLAERVTNAIERDLGPVANPHEVADGLMTKARDEAGPLYEQAYARPVPDGFVERLKPLLQRPSVQKGLNNARRIAQEEGDDPDAIGLAVTSGGQTVVAAAPSWKTLDYIKRGMDDVVEGYKDKVTGRYNFDTEGRAVNNTLRSYLKALDAANPTYASARAAYGGPVSGINAMNAGRRALNMTADDLEARMRGMSPFEKQMFALGTRRAMAELVASKGDSANVINAITGTGKKRAMLARLFGDRPAFNRFADTLGQEKEGFRTYARALSGSPTALNLEDDATLKFATLAADMAVNGGLPITTALRHALKFGVGKIGDKTKQQVAALLSETDSARFKELADALRAEATRRGIFKRKVNIVTHGIGKGVVATQAQ